MHTRNLKIIKSAVILLTIAVILNMIFGMKVLKGNYYWRSEYLRMQYDYLKNEAYFWLSSKKENLSAGSSLETNAQSVPILLYHGVIRDPDWQPDDVSVRLYDFRSQMFALKRAGWQTIGLEDYLAFIRGEKNLPKKSFMLTFDDGRSDSFYPVDPILRTLDYSAVMFVITGRSFNPQNQMGTFHLSKAELQKMLDSGHWEMASHTQNGHGWEPIGPDGETGHFLSNRLWIANENRLETDEEFKARIYKDLLGARKDLEANLGIEVLAFAYPFGDFGKTTENFPESRGEVLDEVKKIYPLSFCQTASGDFPSNYQEGSFLAKRINIDSSLSPEDILNIFESNEEKPADFEDDFSQNKGWIPGWGKTEISQGSLIVKNTQDEDSGLTFLNGSYIWENYSAKADIKLTDSNSKASLAVRYHDGNNYISCDYSKTNISLTEKINKILISETVVPMDTKISGIQYSDIKAEVRGNNVTCFLNGEAVVSGLIDDNLSKGGISFKVWNPVGKDSAFIVDNLIVKNLGS